MIRSKVMSPLVVASVLILTLLWSRTLTAPSGQPAEQPAVLAQAATVVQPSQTPALQSTPVTQPTAPAQLSTPTPSQPPRPASLQAAFAAAAEEFNVPVSVLMSVSWNLSRWENHNGESSTTGGYGLMHLPGPIPVLPEEYLGPTPTPAPTAPPRTPVLLDPDRPTLQAAARLLGLSSEVVRLDPYHNIRGGAALLAQFARDTVGDTPADPARWYGAVAKYSGSTETRVALDFADLVYTTINHGAARRISTGEQVTLSARQVTPDTSTTELLQLTNTTTLEAECPAELACQFTPAPYEHNSPTDPSAYGNYVLANRGSGAQQIDYIVIHDSELPFHKTLSYFQQPWANVSSHYTIRAADGLITQMVPNKDIAQTAGNWYINMHSINIEHEGYAVEGATWYSEPMYRASARLVRYLADKYSIPLDRAHIIGHDNVPGTTAQRQGKMHWDPGPFWDWEHYMELLGAPIEPQDGPNAERIVTIKPGFADAGPALTYCYYTGCREMPRQPASFVHLYTAPDFDAPLVDDPALEGPGLHDAEDWGARAAAGQQFYRVERQGEWEAVYYGGQKAWFYNPSQRPSAVQGAGYLVTPRPGKGSIAVYGRPFPEPAAGGPAQPQRLPYSIPEGQLYIAADLVTATDYRPIFNTWSHPFVSGQEQYYLIYFNHRLAYVRASDVDAVGAPEGM